MHFHLRNNHVIVASAGTGKTHALVGTLCHALLGASELLGGKEVAPERIIATTFSRKARSEIVSRVRSSLEDLALAPEASPFAESLLAVLPEAKVRDRARKLLRGTLRGLRIDTFHGLASKLLSEHSARLGISQSTMLEEIETQQLRSRSVDEALEMLSQRDPAQCLALSRGARNLDALRRCTAGELARLDEVSDRSLLAYDPVPEIEAHVKDIHALLLSCSKTAENARALHALWARGEEAAWADLFVEAMDFKLGRKTPEELAIAEFVETLEKKLPKRAKFQNFAELVVRRREFLPLTRAMRTLLETADEVFRSRLAELGALTFADVQRKLRDGLRNDPETTRIIGEGIDLLVVDEFQDTSPIQGDLVCLLRAQPEVLRKDHTPKLSELRSRGLVIVGDRKQAIYGFRGADVRIFARFCVGLGGRVAQDALGIPAGMFDCPEAPSADFSTLQQSRRSALPLLRTINAFSRENFRSAEQPKPFEIRYSETAEDLSGFDKSAKEALVLWHKPEFKSKVGSSRREEARAVRDAVFKLHLGETALGAQAYKSIAVLGQSHASLEAIGFELSSVGVPFVSIDMRIFNAREVRDVRAMLAHLANEKARLPLLEILRGPWVGLSDESLLLLAPQIRAEAGRQLVLQDDNPDAARLARFTASIQNMRDVARRLGPVPSLRLLLEELQLLDVLSELPRGNERIRNVEHALSFIGKESSFERAIMMLDEAREAERRVTERVPEDHDGVRLLTVHASKGLSFPIVILPDVGRKANVEHRAFSFLHRESHVLSLGVRLRSRAGDWLSPPRAQAHFEELGLRMKAERKRVWYVALTRAERGLVFVGDLAPSRSEGIVPVLRALREQKSDGEFLLEACDVKDAVQIPSEEPLMASAPVVETPESRPTHVRRLRLSPTALSDFRNCPRRFQLVHVLDVPEEKPKFAATSEAAALASSGSGDPRLEGTLAHRLLELAPREIFGKNDSAEYMLNAPALNALTPEARDRVTTLARRFLESEYAKSLGDARIEREVAFRVHVPLASGGELLVSGVIDLVVLHGEDALDVVDYKRSRGPHPEIHAFQLAVYRMAAMQRYKRINVRAGIVFLGAKGEPDFVPNALLEQASHELTTLGARFAEARATNVFPRESMKTCRAIHCGYVPRCHG
jgi:ATP-dependent helicase/nuclease subunit A